MGRFPLFDSETSLGCKRGFWFENPAGRRSYNAELEAWTELEEISAGLSTVGCSLVLRR
jgi:hypothetical protein